MGRASLEGSLCPDASLLGVLDATFAAAVERIDRLPADQRKAFFEEASRYARQVAELADTVRRPQLAHLARILECWHSQIDPPIYINFLIDHGGFLSSVGEGSHAIDVLGEALKRARAADDPLLIRRAHSSIAAAYGRSYRWQAAFHHFEQALVLARRNRDTTIECAVLSNIASFIGRLGLYFDSIAVATDAASLPLTDAASRALRVQNLSTIVWNARLVERRDIRLEASAKLLLLIQHDSELPISSLVLAYARYEMVLVLLDESSRAEAFDFARSTTQLFETISNPAVEILAAVTDAVCRADPRVPHEMDRSVAMLEGLAASTVAYPAHHEEVLWALSRINALRRTTAGEEAARAHVAQIHDFRLARAQTVFRDELRVAALAETDSLSVMFAARFCMSTRPAERDALASIYDDLARQSRDRGSSADLDPEYVVAQHWAFAAEFLAEGSVAHCVKVAALAREIGIRLGMSCQDAGELELATRLHDIGKIALDSRCTVGRRFVPTDLNDLAVRKHAEVGGRLLERSENSILQRAAVIARHHHEWWNGCGYPHALRREEIPIDARICAVANTFNDAVSSLAASHGWTHREILRQVKAMGSFQLDPGIVDVLIGLPEEVLSGAECMRGLDNSMPAVDTVAKARARLLSTTRIRTESNASGADR